jgi:hypothetical protein
MTAPTARPPPGPLRALVLAAESFFDDFAIFSAGNLAFGGALLLVALAAQISLVGNLLAIPLAVPAAGVMRLATAAIRRGTPHFADLLEPYRRPGRVLGVAAAQVVMIALLLVDIALFGGSGGLAGSVLSMIALYALLVIAVLSVVAWPLLLDPEHDDWSVRATLRLAVVLLLARPLRIALLALVVGAIVVLSILVVVPILAFGLALAWLTAAHAVLPAADALEGRQPD